MIELKWGNLDPFAELIAEELFDIGRVVDPRSLHFKTEKSLKLFSILL